MDLAILMAKATHRGCSEVEISPHSDGLQVVSRGPGFSQVEILHERYGLSLELSAAAIFAGAQDVGWKFEFMDDRAWGMRFVRLAYACGRVGAPHAFERGLLGQRELTRRELAERVQNRRTAA